MNRFRQLREEKGLTQNKLAEIIHSNFQTISDYEREKYSPSIETLKIMAKLYNTSIDYLLCFTDVRDPYMSASEERLTPKEKELVSNFRELDEKEQERLLGISMGMKEITRKAKIQNQ